MAIDEHDARVVVLAYEALRAVPEEWADYRAELAEWDSATADTSQLVVGPDEWFGT